MTLKVLQKGIDIAAEHALCEANYLAMLRLLPQDSDTVRVLSVEFPGSKQHCEVTFLIEDQAPYTTFVRMQTRQAVSPWLENLDLQVCLYHDVEMAEVVRFNGFRRLDLYFAERIPKLRGEGEKQQANTFLADWLKYCLQYGYASGEVNLPFSDNCTSGG